MLIKVDDLEKCDEAVKKIGIVIDRIVALLASLPSGSNDSSLRVSLEILLQVKESLVLNQVYETEDFLTLEVLFLNMPAHILKDVTFH